jgi:hypothetical protein
MAATVGIYEWTSTGTRTAKDGGTVRFKNANNATVDLSNPIVVPSTAGGLDFSFEKMLRLQIESNAASFTQISDLEMYTDGANGLGTGISVRGRATTWATPTEGTTTTWATLTDIFTYVSTAALSLGAGPFGSSAYSSTATDEIGSFAELTLQATTAASQGTTPTETLTFAWNEI